ncbi:MAG TPA: bacillithiol system redox-active protein YtxJ [Chitinophagaceae bacterium]
MDWIQLTSEAQIDEISEKSKAKPQVIFKHSIRCGVSSMALSRLERTYVPMNAEFYLLDIISYRGISNRIAALFGVTHESPQVLVISNGKCVYDESHSGINMDEIEEQTQFHNA